MEFPVLSHLFICCFPISKSQTLLNNVCVFIVSRLYFEQVRQWFGCVSEKHRHILLYCTEILFKMLNLNEQLFCQHLKCGVIWKKSAWTMFLKHPAQFRHIKCLNTKGVFGAMCGLCERKPCSRFYISIDIRPQRPDSLEYSCKCVVAAKCCTHWMVDGKQINYTSVSFLLWKWKHL